MCPPTGPRGGGGVEPGHTHTLLGWGRCLTRSPASAAPFPPCGTLVLASGRLPGLRRGTRTTARVFTSHWSEGLAPSCPGGP